MGIMLFLSVIFGSLHKMASKRMLMNAVSIITSTTTHLQIIKFTVIAYCEIGRLARPLTVDKGSLH